MNTNVNEDLKKIIIRNSTIALAENDIQDDTDLISDLGFDSVKLIQLVVDIENKFGFEFQDEDLSFEILSKYSDLQEYIEKRISFV